MILCFFLEASIIISDANSIPPIFRFIFSKDGFVMARIPQCASDTLTLKSIFKVFVSKGLPIYLCSHGIAPFKIFPLNLFPITKSALLSIKGSKNLGTSDKS